MPGTLSAPVLQVDANIVHQVDTSNPQNLFNLWCMLSRCADALPQGRRLENLVWRLLMEEVPNESTTTTATSLPRSIQQPAHKSSADDVPQLSASVDSVENEEAVEFSSDSSEADIVRPRIRRQGSGLSSTGRRERHISSENLEKMVSSIVEQKESLSAPLPEIPAHMALPEPKPEKAIVVMPTPELTRSGSTTTESPSKDSDGRSECSPPGSYLDIPTIKTTTVVRGFSPSQRPYPGFFSPSKSNSEIPAPKSSPAAKPVESKKPRAKFLLGGSSEESYSDHAPSFEEPRRNLAPPAVPKKKMFTIGGSSEEEGSLRSALASPRDVLSIAHKKQTSFANNLTTTIPSTSTSAIIDDDDDSYDESAIEDDDDEWEDSNEEESGKNSVDEKTLFQRVDSKVNLTSRRSLITLALEQNYRRGNLGNTASQSTSAIPQRTRTTYNGPQMVASPNDSDEAPLTMKRAPRGGPMRQINEVPRTSAQPIMTSVNTVSQPLAMSPRTTRRNMMSTELPESLRRHLLWERSQKSSTANAVLKRRHTSHDVANLKQYPQQPHMKKVDDDVNASSWDQDFTREAFGGYHTKGW